MVDVGQSELLVYTVVEADLASALVLGESDAFPTVLATARLVALMEIAAARLMRPLLDEGKVSVGVSLELEHTAPTPPGVPVEVRAVYEGPEGRLHRFRIEATDPGGAIGRASHVRAIVDPSTIEARAAQRR
jgi:predicted thioesterase